MLLFSDAVYMLVMYASTSDPMCLRCLPDVDFIRPCGVVVFDLCYCRLDLCCVVVSVMFSP